jgi:uncharacterized protein (DUF305 family)
MRRSFILVVVLAALAGGCAGPSSTSVSAYAQHNAADVAFAQALIPHHRAGIALAAEVTKARPSLRTLAEAIIATQQDEVVRMTSWLDKWGASQAPPATPAPLTTPITPIRPATSITPATSIRPATSITPATSATSVTPAGDPVKALAAQQAAAIKIAQQEQGSGSNPAALDFARQIIESRTAQIAELNPA